MKHVSLAGSGARRIAILAPMPSELRPLRAPLALRRARDLGVGFFRGALGELEVVAGLTGMGLSAGSVRAREILDVASPDHLIVVGIAGGLGESVGVGDLVVPERVMNLATGEHFVPVPLGDEPPRGTLASSDALLESPRDAQELGSQGVVAIDMETAAIASVCQQRGCPWSVFRAISDRADDGTTDSAILELANQDGTPNGPAVVRFLLKHPGRIPQLVRLARGTNAATRAAADAVVAALMPR